ncbi:helix-turn-helix domain-containing protein [Sphingosinicella microcystinivorans]|nr:helix-turn-helix domain-containing protein [Sphingosinicella microcystinivorans]WBX86483.1 helix-turn-helix domain-containing protein [Sphingosinicella microcystinivorans]
MSRDAFDPRLRPLTVRVRVAASMLGIGRSKLYELIAAGEIETIKIGNATLIPVECLESLINSRRARIRQS